MTDDTALKALLDKIDWGKYIEHGTIEIRVRAGKKTLVTVSRTYPG